MHNPNDDPDVTSGTTDGAQMETTSAPDVRYMAACSAARGSQLE